MAKPEDKPPVTPATPASPSGSGQVSETFSIEGFEAYLAQTRPGLLVQIPLIKDPSRGGLIHALIRYLTGYQA